MSTPKAAEGPERVLTKPILTLSCARAGAQAKAAKMETVNRLLITGKRMNDSWQNHQKRKKPSQRRQVPFCAKNQPAMNEGLPF
jgi:hypothetical protein